MNREILFRGKRIDNGEWIGGCFFKWPCVNWKELSCVIVPVIGLENGIAEQAIVEPATVGQWTGLTDKNGKKIFEGDIIRFDGEWFVVFWNGEAFQWQAKSTQAKENAIIYDTGNPFSQLNEFANTFDFGWIAAEPILSGEMTTEVVGNIHDNPELLEG